MIISIPIPGSYRQPQSTYYHEYECRLCYFQCRLCYFNVNHLILLILFIYYKINKTLSSLQDNLQKFVFSESKVERKFEVQVCKKKIENLIAN